MSLKSAIILAAVCVSAVMSDKGSFASSGPIDSSSLNIANRNDQGSEQTQQVYYAPTTRVYQDFQPNHHIGFGDQGSGSQPVHEQGSGSQQVPAAQQQQPNRITNNNNNNINNNQRPPIVAPTITTPPTNTNNFQAPQQPQQGVNPSSNLINNQQQQPNQLQQQQPNQQQQSFFPGFQPQFNQPGVAGPGGFNNGLPLGLPFGGQPSPGFAPPNGQQAFNGLNGFNGLLG